MRFVNTQTLLSLQKEPGRIRNICIMAHVDHGKTTLADSLVASNGIISSRMVGKLRYMDSRKDEQERGITMKSSCIALYFQMDNLDYLVNLIDSPGHVDFSSEVSTAVRLCDGAVILVDVIEGVCPQTQVSIRQAWLENIKPVLVINKIDRLILERKLSPLDAYVHIVQLLEQVNAVMGDLFKRSVEENQVEQQTNNLTQDVPDKADGDVVYDWSDGLDDIDDSHLYFSPEQGNVVFASAVDGWGFQIQDFARLYSEKLNVSAKVLRKTLWGDFYLNSKTKRIMSGAQEKAKKPLFVQFILENIWSVYDTIMIRKDKEKLLKIVESLNIKMTARDLRQTDCRVQLQCLCSQWLPLSTAVLRMICDKLPPPTELSEERVDRLMCSRAQSFETYPPETQILKDAFLKCSCDSNTPVIAFISKMFPVERKLLPQFRPKVLTSEEIALRREQARLKHALLQENSDVDKSGMQNPIEVVDTTVKPDEISHPPEGEDVFVAFARVYSGCLRKGQQVYVLGPKHDPSTALEMVRQGNIISPDATLKDLKGGQHITITKITNLYLLMGRELEEIEECPAGNVVGIGGLEEHVLKSATLSSDISCPSFSELQLMAVPILRVAVEPKRPTDMPSLVSGLKLLNQADACVQVIIQETGEHVLVTAGEVHLQRCIDDLQERYAKVPLNVSAPIIPFRETIIPPPIVDMVNEVIQNQNLPNNKDSTPKGLITMCTPNKQCTVKIRAVPLPTNVTKVLESNSELIKTLYYYTDRINKNRLSLGASCESSMPENKLEDSISGLNINKNPTEQTSLSMSDRTHKAFDSFKSKLHEAFKESSDDNWDSSSVDNIWSFGPRNCGTNILINRKQDHKTSVWSTILGEELITSTSLLKYDSSFVNGFQLATLAGPLCEEPMMGVAFIVEEWTLDETCESMQSSAPYGPLSGQIMSVVKEACRKAFQAQPQRLMAAMYSCSIQVNTEVLGKLYALLGKRQGRIVHGDMAQGSSACFTVEAVLPVLESFNFAPELRKQTSGLASPQLVFSHWEVIELDPFWEPTTEEEYLHFGEKADNENRAKKYMNVVRRRKGLAVDEKIVEFAEKQRTLSKNK